MVQQPPEQRVGPLLDGMDAHRGAVEGETLEARNAVLQVPERGHEAAVRTAVEELVGPLGGHGKREGVELLAVLDELVHVVHHVFVEGRGQKAAVAESPVAELGAALAPPYDLSPLQLA